MKINKWMWQTAVAAAVVLSGASLLAAENNSKENRGQFGVRDYKFLSEAARGGMMEVRLGEVAKQKATSQSVRDFAQRMITDHSKANDELRQLAASKGAVIPSEMSHHENATIERFDKLSGREFDKEYAEHMVKDHKKDVKEFEEASRDATDPDLKAFAQKTLGTLREHLRMAMDTEASVK
jgi:putative membrane protein